MILMVSDNEQAKAAREAAEDLLHRTQQRSHTLADLLAPLRQARQDNHFAERIRRAFEETYR